MKFMKLRNFVALTAQQYVAAVISINQLQQQKPPDIYNCIGDNNSINIQHSMFLFFYWYPP